MCATSSIDSHLFIWGGSTSNGLANDFWSYDVSVGAWTSLAVSGVTPSARFRAMSTTVFLSNPPASSPANPQVQLSTPSCSAALSTQPYLAITGGISFFGTVDASLYLINLCTYVGYVIQSSPSWPQARFAGCLARRWSAAAGDSLVLAFGRLGSNGTGTDPLVWTFNFTSQQWISTAPAVGQRLIQSSQNSTQFTASGKCSRVTLIALSHTNSECIFVCRARTSQCRAVPHLLLSGHQFRHTGCILGSVRTLQ